MERAERRVIAAALGERLRALGLPPAVPVQAHRNRTALVTLTRAGRLRVHAGFADAPDEVLAAIVRFTRPGLRRAERLAARRVITGHPLPPPPAGEPARGRRAERPHPGDDALLARLAALHAELDARHFGGALGPIPIRLSSRMRRRLGELVTERGTGRALEIGLSRRHLRRDGWAALTETLLHEMVHQWQATSGLPVDHGAAFRRKAMEVGIPPRAVAGGDVVSGRRRPPSPLPSALRAALRWISSIRG
ncbi:MAG: SprT-like domain-containing protein [Gemmatimonadales bacterium]|nr:SprT-like domain-containing protein [Gemmatimonadales bacterium]